MFKTELTEKWTQESKNTKIFLGHFYRSRNKRKRRLRNFFRKMEECRKRIMFWRDETEQQSHNQTQKESTGRKGFCHVKRLIFKWEFCFAKETKILWRPFCQQNSTVMLCITTKFLKRNFSVPFPKKIDPQNLKILISLVLFWRLPLTKPQLIKNNHHKALPSAYNVFHCFLMTENLYFL